MPVSHTGPNYSCVMLGDPVGHKHTYFPQTLYILYCSSHHTALLALSIRQLTQILAAMQSIARRGLTCHQLLRAMHPLIVPPGTPGTRRVAETPQGRIDTMAVSRHVQIHGPTRSLASIRRMVGTFGLVTTLRINTTTTQKGGTSPAAPLHSFV